MPFGCTGRLLASGEVCGKVACAKQRWLPHISASNVWMSFSLFVMRVRDGKVRLKTMISWKNTLDFLHILIALQFCVVGSLHEASFLTSQLGSIPEGWTQPKAKGFNAIFTFYFSLNSFSSVSEAVCPRWPQKLVQSLCELAPWFFEPFEHAVSRFRDNALGLGILYMLLLNFRCVIACRRSIHRSSSKCGLVTDFSFGRPWSLLYCLCM